jgi:hypothetical protein
MATFVLVHGGGDGGSCWNRLSPQHAERRARQLDADQLFEIDIGHDLMITEPAALADMLAQAAAKPATLLAEAEA